MSTILKALKKLEERKASEGKRRGDIAWDILREGDRHERPVRLSSSWLIITVALALSLVMVLWWIYPSPRVDSSAEVSGVVKVAPTVPTAQPRSIPVPTAHRDPAEVSPASHTDKVQPVPLAATQPSSPPVGVPLVVSGIAFQDAPEARMAIVNDLPVMVGTVIEEVVVERIEEQQVVFSRQGQLFTVSLTDEE